MQNSHLLNQYRISSLLLFFSLIHISCNTPASKSTAVLGKSNASFVLVVLGNVQDAGSPHIDCQKSCCKNLFENPDPSRKVVSLGLIDQQAEQKFLIEATPDITTQMRHLKQLCTFETDDIPDGVLLTHAHIGHYTGLMYFGREAKGAYRVPVFAMPEMQNFLTNNGPWDQLVSLKNIIIQAIDQNIETPLTSNLKILPIKVPHRDEYSETVGYIVKGPNKSALFIPDIDKWEKWDEDIIDLVFEVDYAFLDATFYDQKEIKHRDISEIPHPFAVESFEKFKDLPKSEKNKIYFLHLNHTNPMLDANSEASKKVSELGFHVARFNDQFQL